MMTAHYVEGKGGKTISLVPTSNGSGKWFSSKIPRQSIPRGFEEKKYLPFFFHSKSVFSEDQR